MKKYLVLILLMVSFLLLAGGPAKADGFFAEPEVTWDPQSRCFPAGSDAVYSVTASGRELSFSWSMEFNGTTYDITEQKDALMAAGLSAYCSDIRTEDEKNRSRLIISGVKEGIDSIYGKFTKVYCVVSNPRASAFSNNAYVLVGPKGIPYPPEIYIKPVAAFIASDIVPKVACDVFEEEGAEYHYQWYEIEQGKLEYAMAVMYADDSPILIPDFAKQYTDYICMVTVTKNGVSADSWSSPVNVYEYIGNIDPSIDQLVITQKPEKNRFELGDKVDLTGLRADYYENGEEETDVPLDQIETDISVFDYAGPVCLTLRYKNQEAFLRVWVDPDADGNWVLTETPAAPETTEAETPTTAEAETKQGETQPETEAPTKPAATTAAETADQPPTESASDKAPETQPAATQGGSEGGSGSFGGNTVLIVIIIVMALIIGLLGGILLGRRKEK